MIDPTYTNDPTYHFPCDHFFVTAALFEKSIFKVFELQYNKQYYVKRPIYCIQIRGTTSNP